MYGRTDTVIKTNDHLYFSEPGRLTRRKDQVNIMSTSLANLMTHQAQRHSQSLVCFVRMCALALVRTDGRLYVHTDIRTDTAIKTNDHLWPLGLVCQLLDWTVELAEWIILLFQIFVFYRKEGRVYLNDFRFSWEICANDRTPLICTVCRKTREGGLSFYQRGWC